MKVRHLLNALAEGTVLAAWVVVAYVTHDALSRGDAELGQRERATHVTPAAQAASAPVPKTLAVGERNVTRPAEG